MQIEEFVLERQQSLWENEVDINLTESGVHPYTLRELLSPAQIDELLDVRLGYGWTNGEPDLRGAIAQHYRNATREQVLVTNGSAEANFLSMWTLLEPGDEIALMLPNYMQIWGVARALGVTVRPFHLRSDGSSWNLDLAELEALVSPATKAIVLCNPNNPTGSVLSPEEMQGVIDLASANGTMVYADEVYKGVELTAVETPSFADVYEQTVVASGLSKALAHPGLRVGWLLADEEFVAAAWHRNDYTTITTSVLSERVAEWILEPTMRQRILDRNRGMLRDNLAMLTDWVALRPDRFRLVPPQAGGMAFLEYFYEINSTELTTRLREDRSVLIVPGDAYGMDRHVRIGIGEEAATLERGLRIFGDYLDALDSPG